jgi:hypothetical protein
MKSFISLLILPLLLGALVTDAFSGVYKHTNPDGSVTFSDVPAKKDEKPIKLPPTSTYSPPPPPPRTESTTRPKPAMTETNYESVSITSPSNDTAVRNNAGNLTINFNVKPSLKPGHSYVLLMDGKKVGEGTGGSVQLTNLDRGSHTFTVQVVDANQEMIIQSTDVLVHLQRAVVP